MVNIILTSLLIFSSLGIYTRLKKFGAPLSSILYAGAIPLAAIFFNAILGIRYVRDNDDIRGINKLFTWIIFQFEGFRKLSLVITLFVVRLGSKKVGFIDLFKTNTYEYSKIFTKVKEYVECQIKNIFNSSYEDVILKRI